MGCGALQVRLLREPNGPPPETKVWGPRRRQDTHTEEDGTTEKVS